VSDTPTCQTARDGRPRSGARLVRPDDGLPRGHHGPIRGETMSTAPKLSTTDMATMQPGTSTPLGALKQVDAGLLSVGYAEAGPADGSPVLLLHGWPYDIHSFADVTPLLASAGYRVVVPFVRGYGTTRFLSDNTLRNGQQAALAADVIALMDALGIAKAVLAGFDWGPGRPTSSRRCGRNAARPWSR